ncbi:MAG: SDR family oxidoreductase, partial [Clostridiales bacterium]|nr:SDR family oxidoreductase [Clostridiales bacterium]
FSSKDSAHRLSGELGIKMFKADVSDSGQVRRMFAEHDAVDILVCSAGVSLIKLFTDTAEAEWRRLLDINLAGVINCCQAAIPHMVRQKYGRIVLVSSVWGTAGASCEAVYAASKSALHGLAKSLAKELGPSGITVNCVAPGVIDTDMNAGLSPEVKSELIGATPAGRLGAPRDVAALVRFLASDSAGFITGQIIGVDGGFAG